MLKADKRIIQDDALETAVKDLCALQRKLRFIKAEMDVLKKAVVEFANGADVELEVPETGKVIVKQNQSVTVTDYSKLRKLLGNDLYELFITTQTKVRDGKKLLELSLKDKKIAKLLRKKVTPRVNIKPVSMS